jgi:hypothetical protein
MKTINTKQKLFEMMQKVNPDFRINEINLVKPPPPGQPPPTPETDSSIVDDGQLTVGELKAAISAITHSKTPEEAKKKVERNQDVLKCVVGLIAAGAFVAGTGGVGAVVIGIGGIATTAHDVRNVFKKLLGPKVVAGQKTPNEFMKLLQIDDKVSVLLDDKVELAFIEYAINILMGMPNTAPVPDFFERLKEFIDGEYSKTYNLAKK